jgi:hypothetical protein
VYSQIICVCPVDNDKNCEREFIKEFKNEFEFRNDIGHEYFKGDVRDMISIFNDYVSEHLPNTREDVDMNYHWKIEDQRMNTEKDQMSYKKQWYLQNNSIKFYFLFFILNVITIFLDWKIH